MRTLRIMLALLIPLIYLLIGLANTTIFYSAGVHDCSNMAAEQVYILEKIGFEPTIYTGLFEHHGETVSHAWYSVAGLEINPVSFLPMSINTAICGYKQLSSTPQTKQDLSSDYFKEGEFDLRFNYYLGGRLACQ